MVNFNQVEAEVQKRFQARARGPVLYREMPTVGSDRDVISFMLEWGGQQGEQEAVAVHMDRFSRRIICYPTMVHVDPNTSSFAWLDELLTQVPR